MLVYGWQSETGHYHQVRRHQDNVTQELDHKISDGLPSTEVPPSAATVCHQNACFSPVPVALLPAADARTQSPLL